MKKQRKQYAPEEKVAILRQHFLENEPISTVFYRWQKEFFENGAADGWVPSDFWREDWDKQAMYQSTKSLNGAIIAALIAR